MAEIANTLGITYPFSFGGTTVEIAPRDFEIEGRFEVWLEAQAVEVLQRHRETLYSAEYEICLVRWQRDCAAGVYSVEGHTAQMSLSGPIGQKHMICLQICKGSPKVNLHNAREFVEKVWSDPESRKLLLATVEAANADPNRARPWRGQT